MAKGRMLQNRISKSLKMASLSNDTVRLLYTWMLSHLDVNGNFYADPVMVNNLIFTRLGHSIETIASALDELAEKGLIIRYEINGERYLNYPDFQEKQPSLNPSKEGKTEIPELTDEALACARAVKEVNINKNNIREGFTVWEKLHKKNASVSQELLQQKQEAFLIFYKAYPKKMNKKEALAKWMKADLPDISIILKAIEKQKVAVQWQNRQYIPYPATWINQERWTDEIKEGDYKNGQGKNDGARGNWVPKEYTPEQKPAFSEEENIKKIKKIVKSIG